MTDTIEDRQCEKGQWCQDMDCQKLHIAKEPYPGCPKDAWGRWDP